jgi:dTDP-4-amino-4,6-dideoxygalactose transaminase
MVALKIPFLTVAPGEPEVEAELRAAMERVLASGSYVGGAEVEAFEHEFAGFTGSAHCVSVGNGLDALRLALLALGIGPGDEVIVPSHTFIATWLAVSQCGATPVPAEPAAGGFLIDPASVEAAITDRTRAIVPVHLYGEPCDLPALLAIARRHGLFVVEDAAQCHGARVGGVPVGAQGHAVTWSFYPAKNLGALGDGGAVTTGDAALAERVRMLANYGGREKYRHELMGFNSRLDALQAAILRVKLGHLPRWNRRRQAIAAAYQEGLAATPLALPGSGAAAIEAVWHLYVVRHPRRADLQAALASQGVQALIHYPTPCHRQPAYAGLAGQRRWHLPAADLLAAQVLSLPIGPHLDDAQVAGCIAATRRACEMLA